NSATWTPWERVQTDIEGDHLLPIVWNRRLQLFWPIFSEKTETTKNVPKQEGTPAGPSKSLLVKLAWSEYRQGKWSPKQIMDDTVAVVPAMEDLGIQEFDHDLHVFKGRIDNGDLVMRDVVRSARGYPIQRLARFQFLGCFGRVATQVEEV